MQCSCQISLSFCCAHRIVGHEGKCANLHGHNYLLTVEVTGEVLDSVGRVADFSHLKNKLRKWIEQNWDHSVFIWDRDEKLLAIKDCLVEVGRPFVWEHNSTAENMAIYLMREICPKLFYDDGISVLKVELAETDNNRVVVKRDFA